MAPRLIQGKGGVFEVHVGGDLLFSKKATDRFPEPGEVEAALRSRMAASTPASS